MKPTDTLVTKYDIIIPFYTSENVTKSVRNIYDHELCKEVIRLYFLNKLDRVWRNPYGSYYYRAKGSLPEYYRLQILTSVDIEKIIAQKKRKKKRNWQKETCRKFSFCNHACTTIYKKGYPGTY